MALAIAADAEDPEEAFPGFSTRTPSRARFATVARSPRVNPVSFIHRARSASSNFSGCDAAYRSNSRSASAGRTPREEAPPPPPPPPSRRLPSNATMSLLVASPKMISSSTRPISLSPRSSSAALMLAATLVCTLSFACASTNLGRFSTTRRIDPVVLDASTRLLAPAAPNAAARSANALSAEAKCASRSSTQSGSCSFRTASFCFRPAFVSIAYAYNPASVTGKRSRTSASYVQWRANAARGSTLRSRINTSHPRCSRMRGSADFFSRAFFSRCFSARASIWRYTRWATAAAGEPPGTPSGPTDLYRMRGANSPRLARRVATRVAHTSAARANSGCFWVLEAPLAAGPAPGGPAAKKCSRASGWFVTNDRESLHSYSRLSSASEARDATRPLHFFTSARCAGGTGLEKKTCAPAYGRASGVFPAKSAQIFSTEAREGETKYTASRCRCGSRPTSRFSTSDTPAPVRSLIPQQPETTRTVTASTTRTRQSPEPRAAAWPSMSSRMRRREAARKLSWSSGDAIAGGEARRASDEGDIRAAAASNGQDARRVRREARRQRSSRRRLRLGTPSTFSAGRFRPCRGHSFARGDGEGARCAPGS